MTKCTGPVRVSGALFFFCRVNRKGGMYMKFSHRAALLAAMAAAAAGLAGCGGAARPAGSSDLIMIGANLEMTGSNASFGTSSLNGIHMAVEDANVAGGVLGKKIQVIGVDNRSEVAGAADALAKLAESGVTVIIGPDTSSNVIALASAAAADKIPIISPSGTNPDITVDPKTGRTREYLFRACFTDPYQGRVMADFATDRLNAKTAVVLVDNSSDYSKGLAEFFTKRFQDKGGRVPEQEAYMARDVDFKPILTKVAALKPDILFVPGYYQEVGLIIRQAREMGLSMPIVGGDGWDSDKLVEIAGVSNLSRTYFCNHYSADDNNPKLQDFVKRYEARYGTAPDSFAVTAYDAAGLALEAIRAANSDKPADAAKALTTIRGYDGISGKITIDEQHNTVSSGIIMSFENGRRTFMERIDPD